MRLSFFFDINLVDGLMRFILLPQLKLVEKNNAKLLCIGWFKTEKDVDTGIVLNENVR